MLGHLCQSKGRTDYHSPGVRDGRGAPPDGRVVVVVVVVVVESCCFYIKKNGWRR